MLNKARTLGDTLLEAVYEMLYWLTENKYINHG
nr:MAG TPA: Variant erythrocyte surface antigen-1 [Caudoviricetes sp.]